MTKNGDKKDAPKRKTLMELQENETGNAPMLATLRIAELDKLVSRLKQRQANFKQLILEDEKKVFHIDKEVEKITTRFEPLQKRLEQRRAERAALQKQHDEISQQFGQILSTTKERLRKSNNDQIRTIRREANAELTASRGFYGGQGSTVKQKVNKRK